MQHTTVKYTTWQDRGGNVGVQCLECMRTHWDSKLPIEDPTTGKPCVNCQAIKDSNLVEDMNKPGAPRALHQLSQPDQEDKPQPQVEGEHGVQE